MTKGNTMEFKKYDQSLSFRSNLNIELEYVKEQQKKWIQLLKELGDKKDSAAVHYYLNLIFDFKKEEIIIKDLLKDFDEFRIV
jgi:hypothetical protein